MILVKGNIIVITVIALGIYGYLVYLRREGRPVQVQAGTKKSN